MNLYDKSGADITLTVPKQTEMPVGVLLEQLLLETVRKQR